MHDFIQSLSFRSAESSSGRQTAGASELTIAATPRSLYAVMRSFDDGPPFTASRPLSSAPFRNKPKRRAHSKPSSSQFSALN